jgi:hypothetical protein
LLAANAAENVYPFRAALWSGSGTAGFVTAGKKRKKSRVRGDGGVPLVTIDGIATEGIGFICLDLEGAEIEALKGARETLRSKPVVAVEVKHQGRYGYEAGEEAVLEHLPEGYRVAARYGLDTVFVHDQSQ